MHSTNSIFFGILLQKLHFLKTLKKLYFHFLPSFYSLGYVNSKISFYLQRDRYMHIDCMVSISKDVNAVQYLLCLFCGVICISSLMFVCFVLCSVQRWMKKRVQSDRCRLPCCVNGWPRWSDYSMMVITFRFGYCMC